jgi:sulfur carrier protein ThiS
MASTVTVRLYAELNDFVPTHRRKREHVVDVEGGRSVKDAIESLGVPHTEVELILVDGEPVGLDRRLDGGSRVSVFPHFATLAPDTSPRSPATCASWGSTRCASRGGTTRGSPRSRPATTVCSSPETGAS